MEAYPEGVDNFQVFKDDPQLNNYKHHFRVLHDNFKR